MILYQLLTLSYRNPSTNKLLLIFCAKKIIESVTEFKKGLMKYNYTHLAKIFSKEDLRQNLSVCRISFIIASRVKCIYSLKEYA